MEPLTLSYSPTDAQLEPNSYSTVTAEFELERCLMCNRRFVMDNADNSNEFLKHLLEEHKLIIGEVEMVASLKKYVQYWALRLDSVTLEDVCVKMRTLLGDTEDEKVEFYYMLCTALPEDREVRQALLREKLTAVLHHQEIERADNSWMCRCLFCNETFIGNRSLVLNHMNEDHGFNIGHPDNIVFAEQFISSLRHKLDSLICLYCEKTFRDKLTLKEHMRKKLHKRLDPRNRHYDKYYLVNYLDLGKSRLATPTPNMETFRTGRGGTIVKLTSNDSEGEEEGWQEIGTVDSFHNLASICLFCSHTTPGADQMITHLKTEHGFDIQELKNKHSLTFYQQVKIINYIRRQVHHLKCLMCDETFPELSMLTKHLSASNHLHDFVVDRSLWDQPEYYFPTFENDNLLSALECDSMENQDCVIPEDEPKDCLTALNPDLVELLQQVLVEEPNNPLPPKNIKEESGALSCHPE